MTESSNGYSTSRERTVGVSAQVRAREVAPERWEKAKAENPTGAPVTEQGNFMLP